MTHPSSASEPGDRGEPASPAPAAPGPPGKARTVHPLIVRLVAWRKTKDWTQEQTAEHLEIPLNTLRGYECGNRNPGGTNAVKILTLIGLPTKRAR